MTETRFLKGDIVRSPSGVMYGFSHYDDLINLWVIPLTKSGNIDKRHCGLRIPIAGTELAKRGKRAHRWSGAGYVCADCGAIKDTNETKDCPGPIRLRQL